MSIIKELGGLVTGQLVKQVANSLGESESGIGKVIGALAPTILGGLLNKSSDTGAFGKIFDMLGNKDNASYLDNLGGLIGGGNLAQGDPRDASGALMGSIFGDKVGGIIDMVSSIAGVNKKSSSSLMGMVGPMIMGYLGKKILSGGLNASGLAGLLSGERNNIAEAMPNQLADLIGFEMPDSIVGKVAAGAAAVTGAATDAAGKVVGTAGDVAGDAAKAAAGVVGDAAGAVGNVAGKAGNLAGDAAGAIGDTAKAGGSSLLKYLLPLLLLAGAFFAWKSCGDDVKNAGSAAIETAGDAAGAVGDAATKGIDAVGDVASGAADAAGNMVEGLGAMLSRTLPGGVSLNVPENGIESNLLSFIQGSGAVDKDTWFNFDRLNFATGSANLDMGKSQEQLDNIAAILKAFPNVNVKIGGYTDNTGNADSNLTLSDNRAKNVVDALQALGIAANRMESEGYGIAHPVATNSTPEGRAQNRRIAVRVTKK